MAEIPSTYLTGTKNLAAILAAVKKAGVPNKFTYDFLKQLGYPSSQDRPLIPLMKAMGFLDANGTPTERYRRFRDDSQSQRVVAEGMRDAYSGVFAVDQEAYKLTGGDLKGIFARLSGKSEDVAHKMALTFKALAGHAEFTAPQPEVDGEAPKRDEETLGQDDTTDSAGLTERPPIGLQLHHDIHVHLPASTDIAVFDAIFRALRQNFAER
jgi:hypothetical protein